MPFSGRCGPLLLTRIVFFSHSCYTERDSLCGREENILIERLCRWSVPAFLLLEGALYLSFLALDLLSPGPLSTALKYAALLLCLNPVSPHMTEEMWEICGFGEPIYTQSWPTYDENKLVADEVEIAVQIKGKVRGRIMVPASLGKDDGEKLLENETVKKLVGDAQVKKIIFVPGRLLNIVC